VVGDDFTLLLADETVDAEEREALRQLRINRQQEEAARKRQLQAEFERKKLEALEQQMYDFQQINERKRKEEAEKAAALAVS
jgi:formylmethanofuran dehydrogenase subunit E